MSDEMAGVFAWECENCGEWRPAAEVPYAVLVDVPISTEVFMEGGVSKRLRTRKVMVVCPACQSLMGSGRRP